MNQQQKPRSTYQIKKSDLPLACPVPSMELWNQHPKVYLAIEKTGKIACPYCGTQFELLQD